jgi:phosphoenolpyruvate synthase/pyruvate phosphate dikinase
MIISGKVRIINDEQDYYKIKKEVIIIARNTHPDIVIIINKIKAIITEIDNRLCHAAIIAREYQKPILMGMKNATKEFKNGDKIAVNISRKQIYKIK